VIHRMQTSYFRYMVEIDRTRSITQAAANLFLTQPSLSRILHELEGQLGYPIFERSNRGVRPTPDGVVFLRHARRILNELEEIESLGGGKRPPERFHVCMPRSAGILEMTAEYLNRLSDCHSLDAVLRECHVRQAFDYIESGEIDLGIIRFRAEYLDYFEDLAAANHLGFEALNRYRYRVILRRDNPLATRETLKVSDLARLTEITHGDTFRMRGNPNEAPRRCVYSVDRHAQLRLMQRIPNAFMWSTSMLPGELEALGLVQLDAADNRVEYRNALVSIAPEMLNDIERGFLAFVRERCSG